MTPRRRHAVEHEPRAIVDEALSLEDRQSCPERRTCARSSCGQRVVGETIAPRTNALGHERPSMNACATTATPTVVASTRPTASSPIGRTSTSVREAT